MKSRSYNSVGAGDKPKLGYCKSVMNEARPGANQSAASVKVSTDIPKAARPKSIGSGGGQPPKTAGPRSVKGAWSD